MCEKGFTNGSSAEATRAVYDKSLSQVLKIIKYLNCFAIYNTKQNDVRPSVCP